MVVVSVVRLCFFFFKQKTAYELRISDWSSDVCSSDLRDVWRIKAAGAGGYHDIAGLERVVRDVERAHVEKSVAAARRQRRQSIAGAADREIGRASRRARVGLYV